MATRRFGIALSAAVMAVLFAVDTLGQSQQATPDVANQMLIELKGLRADINRFTAIGARTQVMSVRLQLQEQRLARVSAELSSIRTQRETFETGLEANSKAIEETENAIRASKNAAEAAVHERLLADLKGQSPVMETQVQLFRGREEEATRQLAYEQGAWNDLSNRLDELERQLTVR